MSEKRQRELVRIHRGIDACRTCPKMAGTPVHGPAVLSPVFLLGQAPGPHEAKKGRPFAHTAGKTLFRWFEEAGGVDETRVRERVYIAAVARCFPGKGSGGGDRVPDAKEIEHCSKHLRQELAVVKPKLVIAVGRLAIEQVLGRERFGTQAKLADVVGKVFDVTYLGQPAEAICLPHPSGLSSWHKLEPGVTLLRTALRKIVRHPAWSEAFAP